MAEVSLSGGSTTSESGTATTDPSVGATGTDPGTVTGGQTGSTVTADGFSADPVGGSAVADTPYYGPPKEISRDFTYPTHSDPMRASTPKLNPYLDDVMRQEAEIARAKVEGREPDLVNPPATQSTPLFPTDVVKSGLMGDHAANVVVDVTLPVTVGIKEEDVDYNEDARRYREDRAAVGDTDGDGDVDADDSTTPATTPTDTTTTDPGTTTTTDPGTTTP